MATKEPETHRPRFDRQQTVQAALEAWDALEKQSEESLEVARRFIRQHPVKSMAIGVGVGALLGAILLGRKD